MITLEELFELEKLHRDFIQRIQQLEQQDAKNSNELSQQQAELAYYHELLADIDVQLEKIYTELGIVLI